MKTLIRPLSVALLGVTAAVLVSCGSSGTGLIPAANGTSLQGDFEAVARAAAAGNGNCAATESALGRTDQDFLALPATVDRGLHKRLEDGIANLRTRAREMCTQLTPTATSTASTETTPTSTTTTPTSTETTPTTTPSTTTTTPTSTATTPTTTTPPGQSGGTEAGEGAEAGAGKGKGEGNGREGAGNASGGGTGVGGASSGSGK